MRQPIFVRVHLTTEGYLMEFYDPVDDSLGYVLLTFVLVYSHIVSLWVEVEEADRPLGGPFPLWPVWHHKKLCIGRTLYTHEVGEQNIHGLYL